MTPHINDKNTFQKSMCHWYQGANVNSLSRVKQASELCTPMTGANWKEKYWTYKHLTDNGFITKLYIKQHFKTDFTVKILNPI
jgi:hypothetical protein